MEYLKKLKRAELKQLEQFNGLTFLQCKETRLENGRKDR